MRNLLFRWCFCDKVTHILRTTPTSPFLENFARAFDNLKRKILCTYFPQFDYASFPPILWEQCILSINEGGLGIKCAAYCAHTGFVASMLDCSDELRQLFPDFLEQNLPCTHFLRLSVEWIRFASNIEDLDIPMILAMRSDRETENSRPVTLQGQLTKLVERHNLTYLKDYMDNRRLAWFLSSSDAFASTFLNVLPKCPAFTFTSEEMRVLLNHRFYLAQPDRSQDMRCICKDRRTGQHPVIDERAHHCITGCPKRRLGGDIHDAVVHTLGTCFNALGYGMRKEVNNLFTHVQGDFTEQERRMRPDLFIKDIAYPNLRGCLVDVSIASPVPLTENGNLTRESAVKVNRASSERYSQKMEKYNRISNAIGIKFQPFIFETTGRLNPSSLLWLKEAFTSKKDGFKSNSLLLQYWCGRLGCAFQHQIAKAIIDTFNYQKGTRHIMGYENHPSFKFDGPNTVVEAF